MLNSPTTTFTSDPSIDYNTVTSVNAISINSYVYGVQQIMRDNQNSGADITGASGQQRRLNSNINGNNNHVMAGRAPSVNTSSLGRGDTVLLDTNTIDAWSYR